MLPRGLAADLDHVHLPSGRPLHYRDYDSDALFVWTDEGIRTLMLPGVRCPTCAANGSEVWVIPGRACGYCRTPAPSEGREQAEDAPQ
ncbi:hypothetical protein B0H67DRAFT_647497 [Lasiosphaeris hirsuta]|uniref:Uncharacterized protein n=1 Tax=Lasiosphaeris hirsuta TaxID=260670 RepID=A0AA40DNG5_9PEZI|nr:hypothetical protein B0H67DRAFT_647497 [Lasiosphaeris hirsuta]